MSGRLSPPILYKALRILRRIFITGFITAGVLFVFILSLGHRILGKEFQATYYTKPFNQAVWKQHHDDMEVKNPRGPMAGDLVKHQLKRGMTRSEVETLLGPPSPCPTGSPYVDVYYIGDWGGTPALDFLRLDYNSNKTLRRATIHQQQG